MHETSERIREIGRESGFDAVGITEPAAVAASGLRLLEQISLGRHADMAWMETRAHQRANPSTLWPAVRSIIMVGSNYGPSSNPLLRLGEPSLPAISVYAQNRDYHDVLKKRLKAYARAVVAAYGCEVKVFVDTAPVMEKPLAAASGVGWQGKHTNLVSRDFGSWLFLGAIFTDLDLEPDAPSIDRCGECRRCLDICPTRAFPAPYQLDAARCISYLTIECKTQIPREFRAAMGNRIYGCDDCLAVCPWNKFAKVSNESAYHARDAVRDATLAKLSSLEDEEFRTVFSGSPIKRIGRDRFVRNVAIAIGNSGDARLLDAAVPLLRDSAALVRGAAVWAVARLAPAEIFEQLKKDHAPRETDREVLSEWAAAENELRSGETP